VRHCAALNSITEGKESAAVAARAAPLTRVSDEFRTQSVWESSFVVRAASERREMLAIRAEIVARDARPRRGRLTLPSMML
jgi:hypothetical protein